MDALSAAIPVLVGVATRALERLEREMSLAQFRVLLALVELGSSPSATVADHLGIAGSSVTRIGDRLEASGHLRRCRERPNRSVVRLELTGTGRELVSRVMAWRDEELGAIVDRLPDGAAAHVASAVTAVVDAARAGHPEGAPAGPIELRVR